MKITSTVDLEVAKGVGHGEIALAHASRRKSSKPIRLELPTAAAVTTVTTGAVSTRTASTVIARTTGATMSTVATVRRGRRRSVSTVAAMGAIAATVAGEVITAEAIVEVNLNADTEGLADATRGDSLFKTLDAETTGRLQSRDGHCQSPWCRGRKRPEIQNAAIFKEPIVSTPRTASETDCSKDSRYAVPSSPGCSLVNSSPYSPSAVEARGARNHRRSLRIINQHVLCL